MEFAQGVRALKDELPGAHVPADSAMARGRTDALALTPAHRDGLRTEAGDCVTGSGHLEAVAYDALHGG